MSTITITAGGKEGSFRGAPGVYVGTLVGHEIIGPFPSKQPKFPGETYKLREWAFALDGAPEGEEMVWWTSGEGAGSKSRTFAILTALFGGAEPPIGTQLDVEKHRIGRRAQLDIRPNDRGYLDVEGIMPLPSAPAKAPARGAQPVAAGAAADSDLPF